MKEKSNKFLIIIPGALVAFAIAIIAVFFERLLPIHIIGGSVIALFLGMVISYFVNTKKLKPGLKFTSKKMLKFAIILLGGSLSMSMIMEAGQLSLYVMIFTLLTCFGGGYIVGRMLKLNWKTSNLISAGTGICGGSAIAAIAPVIDAEDKDIALAMSATFLFDMLMILIFPLLGTLMNLSDVAYGLWCGTAVNDTSSVVAAGFAFTEAAGEFATTVKLTRTLSIIPTVLIFSIIGIKVKQKEQALALENGEEIEESKKINYMSLIPWFILGFIGMSVLRSFGIINETFGNYLKDISKFIMVCSLAAIGLSTNIKDMKSAGPRPMIHGFIISLLVVVVALAILFIMHQFDLIEFFRV